MEKRTTEVPSSFQKLLRVGNAYEKSDPRVQTKLTISSRHSPGMTTRKQHLKTTMWYRVLSMWSRGMAVIEITHAHTYTHPTYTEGCIALTSMQ